MSDNYHDCLVLGIDPGMVRTGVALLRPGKDGVQPYLYHAEVVRPLSGGGKCSVPMFDRVASLELGLRRVLDQRGVRGMINCVGVEDFQNWGFGRGWKLAMATAACMTVAAQLPARRYAFTAHERATEFQAGPGLMSKEDCQETACRRITYLSGRLARAPKTEREHLSDAAQIAWMAARAWGYLAG